MKIPPIFNRLFKSPLSKYGKVLKQEQQRSFEQAHEMGASGEETCQDIEKHYEAVCSEKEVEAVEESMILAEGLVSQMQSIEEDLSGKSINERAQEKYRTTYYSQEQRAQLTLDDKVDETEKTQHDAKRKETSLASKIAAYEACRIVALKGIWAHPIVLSLIGVVFVLGEFGITVPALEAQGFAQTYHIWLLSGVFTALITVSAGLAGRLFAGTQTLLGSISFLIASTVTLAVVLLRWSVPENVVYTFLNFSILVLTTVIAYLFSKDEQYHVWILELNRLRRRIDRLYLKLRKHQKEKIALTTHFQSLAYAEAVEEVQLLTIRKQSLKKQYNEIQARISTMQTYFRESFKEGAASIKIAFTQGKLSKFPLVFVLFTSITLAALTGCEFQSEPERREVMIAIDRSTSMLPHNDQDAQKIFNKLSNEVFQLDKKRNHPYGIRVYIADLGSSFPTVRTVELEDGDHYAFRVEKDRQEAVTAFSEELKSVLEEAMTTKPGVGVTNVNRGLCYLLNLLVTSDFSDKSKVLYLYSDGIESSTVARFENFYRNPSLLMDKYDELSAVFDADCPISDLTGVEINIVHKPEEPSLEEIVRAVGAFWKQRLEDHNATVKVRSNL